MDDLLFLKCKAELCFNTRYSSRDTALFARGVMAARQVLALKIEVRVLAGEPPVIPTTGLRFRLFFFFFAVEIPSRYSTSRSFIVRGDTEAAS